VSQEFPGTKKRRGLTRRSFLGWVLGGSLLSFSPFSVPKAMTNLIPLSREKRGGSISEFFNGEELVYEIGFWLFKRVALGNLSFKKAEKEGQYWAILQTETLGLLGWVSRYRVDTYRSTLEEIEEGTRLRSLSFEEYVKIGSKLDKRVTQFDYQRRTWITLKWRKDGSVQRIEEEIPPGKIYDDFLTASYNFRYGVYGMIERGKGYTVPTFPRKGSSSYEVRVASREEEEKRRRSEKGKDQKEFYLRLILDPEITHSKEGRIEGWLSRDLIPVEGTLKDVLLFGDVKGALIEKNKQSSG
jgi:hypothetical protein